MEEQAKKPYHCAICGKDFTLSVTFKAHTVLHERESPYKCSWCGDVFVKNSIALKDHMRKHLDDWESRKKCKENASEHGTGEVFKCNMCNKNLSSAYNLERHLRMHTGEKPFVCDVCKKRYRSKEALKIHVQKRHVGIDPTFICEFCGEKFDSKSSLARHSRNHKNEVEYKCDECKKIFRSKKVLDNHKKSHRVDLVKKSIVNVDTSKYRVYMNPIEDLPNNTVEKQYTCSLCGKCMTSHRSVLNHMLMHAETALHTCKICGIAFSNKVNLTRHTQKHKNYDKAGESTNVVCEALDNKEKITLYIKNDPKGKMNDDKNVFILEERDFDCGTSDSKPMKKEKHNEGRREDVMVIDEDVVIDVEEVIIADKDDDVLDPEVILGL